MRKIKQLRKLRNEASTKGDLNASIKYNMQLFEEENILIKKRLGIAIIFFIVVMLLGMIDAAMGQTKDSIWFRSTEDTVYINLNATKMVVTHKDWKCSLGSRKDTLCIEWYSYDKYFIKSGNKWKRYYIKK